MEEESPPSHFPSRYTSTYSLVKPQCESSNMQRHKSSHLIGGVSKWTLSLFPPLIPLMFTHTQNTIGLPISPQSSCNPHSLNTRVEWYRTFLNFWKQALCCRSGIFLWVQFQKIGEFDPECTRCMRSKVFNFKKSQVPQKWIWGP